MCAATKIVNTYEGHFLEYKLGIPLLETAAIVFYATPNSIEIVPSAALHHERNNIGGVVIPLLRIDLVVRPNLPNNPLMDHLIIDRSLPALNC